MRPTRLWVGRNRPRTVPVDERTALDRVPALDYLREFGNACHRAMRTAGPVVHDLRVGGASVRLRFAGPALVPLLLPALAHLSAEATGGRPDLTLELWDASSTGVLPPPFPWRGEDVRARGEIRGYNEGGVRAVFHGGIRPGEDDFTAVTIFDQRAAVARFFVLAPRCVPWYERAAPLRTALHWGLNRPGRLLVHAGAIGRDGRGVLLAGPGGTGKSTTAVAALLGGLHYLGDDYVLVDTAARHPVAHSLYATAKLAPAATALLPGLPTVGDGPADAQDEKHVLDVSRLRGGGLRKSMRIIAIVLPRLHPGAPTGLVRASAGAALLALAPSTTFQAPRADGGALRTLADLARRVPAYALAMGGPPDDAVPVLARLLEADGGRE